MSGSPPASLSSGGLGSARLPRVAQRFGAGAGPGFGSPQASSQTRVGGLKQGGCGVQQAVGSPTSQLPG